MKKIENQINEYLDYCKEIRRMSATTVRFKEYVIRKFVKDCKLKDLKYLDNVLLNEWILNGINNGISANSVNTYSSIIVAMVRFFNESGLVIPLNIKLIKYLKEKKRPRKFYVWNEIERVINNTDFVTGLMIRIMYETGMRITELTFLKRTCFNGKKICFIGKGRKNREVYISDDTFVLINEFVKRYRVNNYLWGYESLNDEPPTTNTIRKRLKLAFENAGFDDFYPHALRHSFATSLQIKGASVMEIKEMMGHESVMTTERYLHGFDGRLEELFEKYR